MEVLRINVAARNTEGRKFMPELNVTETNLKDSLKAALIEVLQERRDLLTDALEDAIADIGLGQAIQEGLHGPNVSQDDVMSVLRATK